MSEIAEIVEVPTPTAQAQPAALSLWKLAVIVGLALWLYWTIIGRLFLQWWRDPNFSHGFFVPLFSLYLLWLKRDTLRQLRPSPSWWGIPILMAGLVLLIVGNLGAEIFLSRFSLLLIMAGLVVSFRGWAHQRAILWPWMFLLLMIPIPAIIFSQITFPLQLLASKLASGLLQLVGIPVLQEGNVIQIPAMPLEVAEACSGIRSLLSLTTLAIIYGFMMESSVTVRVVLALASIPIAVMANSLRIVGTGLVVQYWNPDKAEGFFHAFSGWLIFVVALAMLFLLHRVLRLIWRERRAC